MSFHVPVVWDERRTHWGNPSAGLSSVSWHTTPHASLSGPGGGCSYPPTSGSPSTGMQVLQTGTMRISTWCHEQQEGKLIIIKRCIYCLDTLEWKLLILAVCHHQYLISISHPIYSSETQKHFRTFEVMNVFAILQINKTVLRWIW